MYAGDYTSEMSVNNQWNTEPNKKRIWEDGSGTERAPVQVADHGSPESFEDITSLAMFHQPTSLLPTMGLTGTRRNVSCRVAEPKVRPSRRPSVRWSGFVLEAKLEIAIPMALPDDHILV